MTFDVEFFEKLILFFLMLLLGALGWFIKRTVDKSDTSISKNADQIEMLSIKIGAMTDALTTKIVTNHDDMKERFHEIRNTVASGQNLLSQAIKDVEKQIEASQMRIEARHNTNQSNVLQYKDDIVKLNQSINLIAQGNMDILQNVRTNAEKIVHMEDHIRGLRTRVETIERNVMNPSPRRDL